MKLFSFYKKPQLIRIGIEINNKKYDFSLIWDFYKDIRGEQRFPDLHFLQVLVEFDMFSQKNINEILTTVTNLRSIEDLIITEPIRYDVPISRPQKIICLGRNYKKHAEELDNEVPQQPIIFAKMPSALLSHQGTILMPRGIGRVDHEIELALVIGKFGKNIAAKYAMDFVAGYTILNDITARKMQKNDTENKLPWMRSKSFDTFCPLGPFLIPQDSLNDPHNLNISLKVNGELRQQSNTSKMIFKIPNIIQFVSQHMTLNAGDIIATGTPEGISELKAGDVVRGEIEGIGVLENTVAVQ